MAEVAGSLGSVEAILAMFDDRRPLTGTLDAIPRQVAPLGRLPGALSLRRWMLPLYPAAVGQLTERLAIMHRKRPIDLLISTSSAAIKGLRPPAGVPHVCYCHSPARYLWSQGNQYAGRLQRAGLHALGPMLRAWDRATADHVTTFVANSAHVATLIEHAYDRQSVVIHPPARTTFFTPGDEPRGSHWLAVGALEPYKRFDTAIEAARLAGTPLRIIGDGTMRASLERTATHGVTFLGRLSDDELRHEMRTAGVLLFPQVEDFGITAVEAQACGLPIAAKHQGGALDVVQDGITGAMCDGSPRALAQAAERASKCESSACVANAQRFSEHRFEAAIEAVLREHLAPRALEPAHPPRSSEGAHAP